MATTHDKIYSESIIDEFFSNLRSEFGPTIKVYLSDTYKRNANKNLRLSIVSQSNEERNADKFLNRYTIQLKYAGIFNNITKLGYKTFFYDVHRIEQLMLALQGTGEYLDFSIDSIALNDYDLEEENIPGIKTATLIISFSLLKG